LRWDFFMQYWLIKSEPYKYAWDQLVKDTWTFWDGVRNYQARKFLKQMQKSDLCLYYHSNEGKEIVGIAEVIKTAYQDPTTDDERWVAVDIKPKIHFKRKIGLKEIKQTPELDQMILVKNPRLSVQPVKPEEFDIIVKLSNA